MVDSREYYFLSLNNSTVNLSHIKNIIILFLKEGYVMVANNSNNLKYSSDQNFLFDALKNSLNVPFQSNEQNKCQKKS